MSNLKSAGFGPGRRGAQSRGEELGNRASEAAVVALCEVADTWRTRLDAGSGGAQSRLSGSPPPRVRASRIRNESPEVTTTTA